MWPVIHLVQDSGFNMCCSNLKFVQIRELLLLCILLLCVRKMTCDFNSWWGPLYSAFQCGPRGGEYGQASDDEVARPWKSNQPVLDPGSRCELPSCVSCYSWSFCLLPSSPVSSASHFHISLMSSLYFFTWILPTVHLDNDFLTVEASLGIQNEFKVMGLTSHEYPTGPWGIYHLETIFHQKHSLLWVLKTSLIKPGVDNKLKEGLEPRCSTVCKGNRWAWRPERGWFSSGSGMSVFSFSNMVLAIFQFFFVSHILVERVIWPQMRYLKLHQYFGLLWPSIWISSLLAEDVHLNLWQTCL